MLCVARDRRHLPHDLAGSSLDAFARRPERDHGHDVPVYPGGRDHSFKAQGITLSEAGFLLDGTFRQKHSMYVTFSRVKDPTHFTFVVPDRLIDAISDSDPLDPATQQSRLRKIFRKIQDLIRINPQINALVSVWEDTD